MSNPLRTHTSSDTLAPLMLRGRGFHPSSNAKCSLMGKQNDEIQERINISEHLAETTSATFEENTNKVKNKNENIEESTGSEYG